MRRPRIVPAFTVPVFAPAAVALAVALALAAPSPARAGKLGAITKTVKSYVEKKKASGHGHAQGAADLIGGKAGGASKTGSLLDKGKDLLKKAKER